MLIHCRAGISLVIILSLEQIHKAHCDMVITSTHDNPISVASEVDR